jgi:hypothetical protein
MGLLRQRQNAGHFPDNIDEFRPRRDDNFGVLTQGLLKGFELPEKLCVSNKVYVGGLVDEPGRLGLRSACVGSIDRL